MGEKATSGNTQRITQTNSHAQKQVMPSALPVFIAKGQNRTFLTPVRLANLCTSQGGGIKCLAYQNAWPWSHALLSPAIAIKQSNQHTTKFQASILHAINSRILGNIENCWISPTLSWSVLI